MQKNNFVSKSLTAPNDLKFNLVSTPLWFGSLNVVCLTHPAFHGDRTEQLAPLYVNDVFFCEHPVNLQELFFKNQNAGDDALVVAYGALLLDAEKRRMGLPIDGV